MSVHSDQATSTLEEEDPTIQNIPKSINHLEQCLAEAQARLEHLNTLTILHSELTTDFALQKTNELEADRNRIRNGDIAHVRQIAESYLLRYKEAERRNNLQTQRMNGLETRAMMAETICAEQMQLNRGFGEESIRALRQFADIERRRISVVKTANNRTELQNREINRLRNHCEQQEQAIGRFREQVNSLNQDITSVSQQLSKFQSEKSSLLLEKDRFRHETEALRNQILERDELIGELRDRELRITAELRERDAMVETLGEERDRRDEDLVQNRREFQNLLAEKQRDMEAFLETRKREITSEMKAVHRAEIERYQQAMKKQRKDFEDALQEALRETQKLAAQREEYFNNWRRLEESIDAHKRKLHAALSRKMVSKCTELVRDLKDIGADFDNRAVQSNTPRILEPVENVAQRVLEGLASQRESGMS